VVQGERFHEGNVRVLERLLGTQLLQLLTQAIDRRCTPFVRRQQLQASNFPLGIMNPADAKFLLAEEASSP
jgi:hypothetical protein